MANLLADSNFANVIRSTDNPLSDRQLRQLVLDYCKRYQEVYWFESLDNAFAYLELTLANGSDALQSELNAVRSEVEVAMWEYCISLNEVASALHRLLDDTPFAAADALKSVEHIWCAYSCNESPPEFVDREDAVLCELLETAARTGAAKGAS